MPAEEGGQVPQGAAPGTHPVELLRCLALGSHGEPGDPAWTPGQVVSLKEVALGRTPWGAGAHVEEWGRGGGGLRGGPRSQGAGLKGGKAGARDSAAAECGVGSRLGTAMTLRAEGARLLGGLLLCALLAAGTASPGLDLQESRGRAGKIRVRPRGNLWATGKSSTLFGLAWVQRRLPRVCIRVSKVQAASALPALAPFAFGGCSSATASRLLGTLQLV